MRRFTKSGDVVLDPFLGHGTTLIEARELGRLGIGVELEPDVAGVAEGNLQQAALGGADVRVLTGDSSRQETRRDVERALIEMGRPSVQFMLLHPPYHDIISFGESPENLCNAPSVESFIEKYGNVVANLTGLLDRGRHLAVVIGDKYAASEWIPLGFRVMAETMRRDPSLHLKSIIVKNMVNNRAKINQEQLWRYRALRHGFFVFKHEYILVFKKA